MQIDVRGRVHNISLAASKPLLPLYEAIVNSIQAIEDAGQKQGRIDVSVIRQAELLDDKRAISAFEIRDNGIGFTEDNFRAFLTSDTTYKSSRGGKGVGRFLWLAAFDEVLIQSVFAEGDKYMSREFRFSATPDGISDESHSDSTDQDNQTTVKLIGFRRKFQRHSPVKLATIAAYIIEYCLEYLIQSDCPDIWLSDSDSGEQIHLNQKFEEEIRASSESIEFQIDGRTFSVLHVRLYSAHLDDHRVHFCAHDRVVKSEKISNQVPNVTRRLQDAEGNDFVYAAYVEGDVLDSAVNNERTSFTIAEDRTELLFGDITWTDIRSAVVAQSRRFLWEYTEPIRRRKRERIERYISEDAPMYRPVLKHFEDKIDSISPDIGDDALDTELYKAYHQVQVAVKSEGKALLQEPLKDDEDFEEYNRKLKAYFERVSDINKSDLARYVCHRKAILDFFQKQLEIQDDGRYSREDRIHSIIFPMGTTSEEVDLDSQNLWLLDEKLVYHTFLASDKQFRTMSPIASDSKKEPDIIVFDKACAWAASDDHPFSSIVIIEFKRPMREGYSDMENPIDQVIDYVEEILKGKAMTSAGRKIPVSGNTRFYCYIVCDINEKLENLAQRRALKKTLDEQGFFGYIEHINAYFEVVSYDKIVTDAKKRNTILFDKLGLPSNIDL